MNSEMMSVPFHGDTLLLADDHGNPIVPMKPVIVGMGLDWMTQYRKLTNPEGRWAKDLTLCPTQLPGDIQSREVVCLPLRKLPGWLMSINVSKVKPEIRNQIITYQDECDDVLWDYWSIKGRVRRQPDEAGYTPASFRGHEPGSLIPLAREFSGALRLALKHGFSPMCARAKANQLIKDSYHVDTGKLFGLDYSNVCPEEQINRETQQLSFERHNKDVEAFWTLYYEFEGDRRHTVNHSKNPDRIAININHFMEVCRQRGQGILDPLHYKRILKDSKSPAYIEQAAVSSAISGKTVKCWIFRPSS